MELKISQVYLSAQRGNHHDFDPSNGNTDVIVVFDSGDKYLARFFTYNNIEQLRLENQLNGDFLSGKYFHAKPMVLVNNCTSSNIEEVIHDMLAEGDFFEVFKQL